MKLVTYNVDGLPETLDLNDLPWIFKPCVWVYKLIKGTTLVSLNDNKNRSEKTYDISKYLSDSKFDIIGVQEDFNYHKELISYLQGFSTGTFMGAIDFSKIFSMVKWFRYKSDGLNLFIAGIWVIVKEDIVEWKDSYGYFSHCNDKLTRKGFRRYELHHKDYGYLTVYVLHADASEKRDDIEDSETRRKQFTQLVTYIKNYKLDLFPPAHPIIIMGDTNCSSSEMDEETINEYLIKPLSEHINVSEVLQPFPKHTLDRIFVINPIHSLTKVVVNGCGYGPKGLSDHRPCWIDFDIKNN